MGNLLQGCFLYRWALAIFAWFSRVADGSRVRHGISLCWESSKLAAFLHRCLSSGTVQIDESRTKRLLSDCNERLCARKSTARWVESSVLYRVYRGVFTCGRGSRILGWLFRGGMTAILLFAIGLYVLIDYVLRDVLAIPVVSSVWDEALLLLCIVWLIWERKKAASPVAPKLNPLDFPVAIFLTVCFVLLCVVCPYLSIQIAGFRATCQYLLWFYLVTRLIRNDRDCMTLYLTLVALSFVLSLHGIYQYITKAPMPASWVAQAETAVRTRVYSIFGSPNIMGDFMVMFVPMTAALAYYVEKPKYKILAWVAAFSMCFACLFTMSRGAWVAMALAIVLFILLVDRRLFLPLAAGLVLLVLVPFVRTRIGFLFTQDFVDANTNGGRGGRWALGLELLEANGVWTGVGHGMFGGAVAVQNKVLDYIQYFYIDNYYLKTMVETGYLGLGAFVLMQLGMIATSCRSICRTGTQWKAKQSRNYPLVVGMFCGLCGVLVHCFFENIFEEPYMMVYFWAIAAMIVYFGFLRKPQEVLT